MEPIYKKRNNLLVKITPVPAQEQVYSIEQIQQMLDNCDQNLISVQNQKDEYLALLSKAQELEIKTQDEVREEEQKRQEQETADRQAELEGLAAKPVEQIDNIIT